MIDPIKISIDLSQRNDISPYEVYVWCAEQFGVENIVWRRMIPGPCPQFAFLHEEDAVLFALRWK